MGKKIYRVKCWDNKDPVKFLDVSNQKPYFPGIDWLGNVYYGETFFNDSVCLIFSAYDMAGKRFLVFHLKGSKRYLLCSLRMKILNKLKKNIFTVFNIFKKFTLNRYMIENFDVNNYHDDEIVTQITSYDEWLLYNLPEFKIIEKIYIPEQEINKENQINLLIEEKRIWIDHSNIQKKDIYFQNLLYVNNLYFDQELIGYNEPLIFTLTNEKYLYLCIYLENEIFKIQKKEKTVLPKLKGKQYQKIKDYSDLNKIFINNKYYMNKSKNYLLIQINKKILNNLLYKQLFLLKLLKKSPNIYQLIDQGNGVVVQNVEWYNVHINIQSKI